MGGNKFFFEEDSETEQGAGVGFEEQADIFGAVVKEAGIQSDLGSMEPLGMVPEKIEMKKLENTLVAMEYGIVAENYVIHITPTHPKRNLKGNGKLNAAIKATVLLMNTMVPFDLQVKIHHPQESWDVKALSFVIEKGAVSWNFDYNEFSSKIIPQIHEQICQICMKP